MLFGVIIWIIGFVVFVISLIRVIDNLRKDKYATRTLIPMWVGAGIIWIGTILFDIEIRRDDHEKINA